MTTVKTAQRTVNWPSRRAGRRQSGFLLWGMAWNGSVHISRQWLAYFQKNTLHSLSLYPGSLYLPSPPWWSEQANKSSKVNINVCSQRSLDRSYRIATSALLEGGADPVEGAASDAGRRGFFPSVLFLFHLLCLHILICSSCKLTSDYFLISPLPSFYPFSDIPLFLVLASLLLAALETQACRSGKLACHLILWLT